MAQKVCSNIPSFALVFGVPNNPETCFPLGINSIISKLKPVITVEYKIFSEMEE